MKGCTFKYLTVLGEPLPVITITASRDGHEIDLVVFIDSGASYSIFASEYAARLGIEDITTGTLNYVMNGSGDVLAVYVHVLTLKIGTYPISAQVGLSEQLGVGYNILGRKDVFEKLIWCFSDERQAIHVMLEEEAEAWP